MKKLFGVCLALLLLCGCALACADQAVGSEEELLKNAIADFEARGCAKVSLEEDCEVVYPGKTGPEAIRVLVHVQFDAYEAEENTSGYFITEIRNVTLTETTGEWRAAKDRTCTMLSVWYDYHRQIAHVHCRIQVLLPDGQERPMEITVDLKPVRPEETVE